MIDQIKTKVRELLKNKSVELVIGYQRASDGVSAKPCFINRQEDVDLLIWDGYCVYNLANYLKDFAGQKAAVVAKQCDAKSIAVLIQENQLKRENIFVIGIECCGVVNEKDSIGFAQKCKTCQPSDFLVCDYMIKEKEGKRKAPLDRDEYEHIRKMEAKAISERLKFWQDEFKRCIRCYACRQVCPMCYCPKCVADQIQPFWFSKSAELDGNLAWNITRAIHLASRCVDCGECERVCPVGIPLRDINKKIEKDIKEIFHYEAGASLEQKPFFASFDKSDPEEWIK